MPVAKLQRSSRYLVEGGVRNQALKRQLDPHACTHCGTSKEVGLFDQQVIGAWLKLCLQAEIP
eukprot:m.129988 g.129988  ORF g.129988 m.129988 type:complete len:63 (+) comp15866_c0_seq4:2274-2462(+)